MAYGDTGDLPNLTTEEEAEVERMRQEVLDLEEVLFNLPGSDDEDAPLPEGEGSSGEEDGDNDHANPSWGGIGASLVA
jgi:hypothetical protein